MKTLKAILNSLLWTVLALYIAFAVAVHTPAVQRWLGSAVAGAITAKIGSKASVGRVDIGLLGRVVVDDVRIKDQADSTMISAARLTCRAELSSLFGDTIHIQSAQVFGTHIHIYKLKSSDRLSCQFALDSLKSKDNKQKKPLRLTIDEVVLRGNSLTYDTYDQPHTPGKLNTAHIALTNIAANASLNLLTDESIDLAVKRLSMKERSGLELKSLTFALQAGPTGAKLENFDLRLPETSLTIAKAEAHRKTTADEWQCRIAADTHISLADFAALIPKPLPEAVAGTRLDLSAAATATGKRIRVSRLELGDKETGLALRVSGTANLYSPRISWDADIEKCSITERAIGKLLSATAPADSSRQHTLRRIAGALGQVSVTGSVGAKASASYTRGQTQQNTPQQYRADLNIKTAAGALSLRGTATDGPDKLVSLHSMLTTDGLDLGALTGNGRLQNLDSKIAVNGTVGSQGRTNLNGEGAISSLGFCGHDYSSLSFTGSYSPTLLAATVALADPDATVSLHGHMAATGGGQRSASLTADVERLRPAALNLSRKWGDGAFSGHLSGEARLSAGRLADGQLLLTDFALTGTDQPFLLKQLSATTTSYDGRRSIVVSGDHLSAYIIGDYDLASVKRGIADLAVRAMPSAKRWLGSWTTAAGGGRPCELTMAAEMGDAKWLNSLFGIPLRTVKPIEIEGRLVSRSGKIVANLRAPEIEYNGKLYRDVALQLANPADTVDCDAALTRVQDNGRSFRFQTKLKAADDHLLTCLMWDNTADWPAGEPAAKQSSGAIEASLTFPAETSGHYDVRAEIHKSALSLGGKQWDVAPAAITYADGRITVDDFSISHQSQHLKISGSASKGSADSLAVELADIDVEYILDLVNFHSVDFSGRASGYASLVGGLDYPKAGALLTVRDFEFEHGQMGTLQASVEYYVPKKEIRIDAIAVDGPDRHTDIQGMISPANDSIHLNIKAHDTRLDFMKSFTASFIDRLDGKVNGEAVLGGGLSNINLTGRLAVEGNAHIYPLNCDYQLRGDTITLVPDTIKFDRCPVYDRAGNKGYLSGAIKHKHLTRLSYDLDVATDKMLAYDFHDFGDQTFYGTVYAKGDMAIHGRSGELLLEMDITPREGSTFVYNAGGADAIADRSFIQWRKSEAGAGDAAEPAAGKGAAPAQSGNTRIRFNIDCTPLAEIRLLMDPRTGDYIVLHGNGTIKADYFNKGGFNMYGTYTVADGTYDISIQNIIKKRFAFKEGGTLVFGGNPYEAALNLTAVNQVSGVSLSDLNIGSSFSKNTIKVNCLMDITGKAAKPEVGFNIDLPSVSADEQQVIRSLINSEEEMNNQVLYLLGVGRFYPRSENNAGSQRQGSQDQTSLAMQSLLSGTISSKLTEALNSVAGTTDWTFGANISTGDEGWYNAEYEGLLSGRLLNNRLLINGQFGYRDNANTATSSFIGDFDIKYLLTPNGDVALKVYNQTNDRYFTKSSLNTQGIGLILKHDFSTWKKLFKK